MNIRHPILALALLLASTFVLAQETLSPARNMTSCKGKFPNPITDVCWSCAFPISIGGAEVEGSSSRMEIPGDTGAGECVCPAPPPLFKRVGATIGYWEPVRSVDVARKPFCLVGLGGVDAGGDTGGSDPEAGAGSVLAMPEGAQQHRSSTHQDGSFYQAHWYANPLMYLLEGVMDSNCMESGSMDVGYMTEVDPLWNDDELTNILNFESALFTSVLVQASCAVDCVAASTVFPVPFMFWCGGCNGATFPLDGFVQSHIGGAQAASLVAHRLALKLQRELIEWTHHTHAAVCGPFPNPILDKVAFKQMVQYPIPHTEKLPPFNACCDWMGGTTTLSGANEEIPYKGEDYSFFLFRKRVCCEY